MDLYAERDAFLKRAIALGQKWDTPRELELFRFVDPRFCSAADIVSGNGGLHASGRWNLHGAMRISYTAVEPETALAEALANARYYQLPLSTALPRVLVSLILRATRVLDLRNSACRRELGISLNVITGTDWRRSNQEGIEAVTQAWGQAFATAGFEALIVSSAAADGTSVMIFPDNMQRSSEFFVQREVVIS